MDCIDDWCTMWKISLHVDNTQAVLFSKNRKILEDNVDIAGEEVSRTTKGKYLGVLLDQ